MLAWNGHVVFKQRTGVNEGLRSLDLETGAARWQVADGIIDPGDSAPHIRDGIVYAVVADFDMNCHEFGCDLTSCHGRLKAWSVDTGARRADRDLVFGSTSDCAIAKGTGVSGGDVGLFTTNHPISSGNDYMVRHDFADQTMTRVIAPSDHPNPVIMPSALDEANGRVYLVAYGVSSEFEAWTLDGDLLWSVPVEWVDIRSAMLEGDTAYVMSASSLGSQILALDAATGEPRWTGGTDASLGWPAAREGTVFAGGGTEFDPSHPEASTLFAFSDCGSPSCPAAWTGPGAGQTAGIVAAGDLVYIAASGETDSTVRVYAADGCGQATCSPLVTIPVSGIASDMLVDHGKLVVSTSTGIHTFGLP